MSELPPQRAHIPGGDRRLQPQRPHSRRRLRSPGFRYRIPVAPESPVSFRGVEGFVEALTRLRDESGGTIELTPVAVLADDDNLIARVRVTAKQHGRRLDTENCYAFRFLDGKVADGQVLLSDPEHVEDFWWVPRTSSDGPRPWSAEIQR
jgi:hypothetical protein